MAKKKSDEIVVTSCRFNGRSITCSREQGTTTYGGVVFHDNPLPSFAKALEALAEHVVDLCELAAKDKEKIVVTGVTIRELGDDNQQALITATKQLKRAKRKMNISTPLLAMWEPPKKKGEEANPLDRMDESTAKAIAKFEAEVKKYIAGDRAQGQLALEEEKPEKPKKDEAQPEFPAMTEPGSGKN